MSWKPDFPPLGKALGIAIIAVLAVALVSSTGLLSPVTQLFGRVFGGIRASVMGLFGSQKRAA
jgi:hypothetical protein